MEHEGSQMSADSCPVAEICLWNWKELCASGEKNATFASIRVFWYTGTTQGSIVYSLLLSFWGLGIPCSAPCLEVCLSCDQMQTFSTWDWMHTLHAVQDAGKSLVWQCAALLQQESALSKVLSVWSIGIFPYYLADFPYDSCYAILVSGIPSFPPPKLLRMQWSREEDSRRTECFQAAVSEWREVVCVFKILLNWCTYIYWEENRWIFS